MLYPVVSNDLPGERLRTLRESRGLSLREAAKRSEGGITHAHISHLENDPAAWQKVSHAKVLALARAYNLSLNGLLNEVNDTPYPAKPNIFTDEVHLETANIYNDDRRRIPVYDLVSAGPGSEGGVVVAYVDIEPEFVGEHHAYRVSGDSMKPEIEDNDIIIVKAQNYAAIRNDIVCWTSSDGMLCKRLSSYEDGLYVLTSINPNYGAIVTREIHIYGIVVEVRKRRKIYNGNH